MAEETGSRQLTDNFEKAFYRSESDRLSLIRVVNTLLRYRRLLFILPVITCLLLISYGMVKPRTYTASASFSSQTSSPLEMRFTGLAAQLGLGAPVMKSGQSPEFFAALLETNQILLAVADTRYLYNTARESIEGTLVDLYGIREKDIGIGREKAVETLSRSMTVGIGRNTGVVSFSVKAPDALLAVQIVNRILELINDFNLQNLQTQAAAERHFVEGRVEDAEGELRNAEHQLELFLQQNIQFENSPELLFVHDRLQREVNMRQQVYTSLIQAFEQARIDEVRDTPVITIVEEPYLPVRADRRGLILLGVLGVFLGLVFSLFIALTSDLILKTGEEETEDYRNMLTLKRETLNDLRHPWRFFAGR